MNEGMVLVEAAKGIKKFCTDCAHVRNVQGTGQDSSSIICASPDNRDKSVVDLVTGQHPKIKEYCYLLRGYDYFFNDYQTKLESCGTEGRWWFDKKKWTDHAYPKVQENGAPIGTGRSGSSLKNISLDDL